MRLLFCYRIHSSKFNFCPRAHKISRFTVLQLPQVFIIDHTYFDFSFFILPNFENENLNEDALLKSKVKADTYSSF